MTNGIDHPEHYNTGALTIMLDGTALYEPIKVIELFELSFSLGNALKYMIRAPFKGTERADLDKAEWYLKRQIMRPMVSSHVREKPNWPHGLTFLETCHAVATDWQIDPFSPLGRAITQTLARYPETALHNLKKHKQYV